MDRGAGSHYQTLPGSIEAPSQKPVLGYSALPADGNWNEPYDTYDHAGQQQDFSGNQQTSAESLPQESDNEGRLHRSPTDYEQTPKPVAWQSSWRPFYLRKTVLGGFTALMIAMIIALEVMYSLSVKRHGLVQSQSSLRYLWTYGPTTVLITVAAFWSRVEYETQLTAPWLRTEKTGKTSDAMLLDYIDMFSPAVPFRALKKRDFKVAAASTISLLLVIQTIISTALFTLSPVQISGNSVSVVLDTQFVDEPDRFDDPSQLPFIAMFGLETDNMTYPEGCSDTFAYQTFKSTDTSALEVSATVDRLSLELDCQELSFGLTGIEYGRLFQEADLGYWETDNSKMRFEYDSCHVNMTLDTSLLIPGNDAGGADGLEKTHHIMWLGSLRGFAPGQCGSTDMDSNRLLFMSAKLDMMYYNVTNTTWLGVAGDDVHMKTINISSTSLICAPRLNLVSTNVTKNSTGVESISAPLNSSSRTLSQVHPWTVVQAQLKTMTGSSVTISSPPPVTIGNTTVIGNDYFDGVMKACGSDCAQESSLLNGTMLQFYLNKHYQQYAAFLFHQSLKTPSNTTAPGTATAITNRLVVQVLACHLMAGIFALSILVLAGLLIAMPGSILFPVKPGSIISYAVVSALALHGNLPNFLGGVNKETLAREVRLALGETEKQSHRLLRTTAENIRNQKHPNSRTTAMVFPTALRNYSRAFVYVFMLGCFATLEATLQLSSRDQGLGSVPDETYLHYAWTAFPALILSLLGLFLSSVDTKTRLLAPYHSLSKGASFEQLRLDLLRPILPRALIKEFRIKNFAAVLGTIAAFVASKFTIGSASLFYADVFSVSSSTQLRSASTLLINSTYVGDDVSTSTSNLYTTPLILSSNLSFTSTIYEDLILPSFTLDDYLSLNMTATANVSSLITRATVPALRSGLTCSSYPTSDISAGEFHDLKITQYYNTTYNGISVNITGQQCSEKYTTNDWVAYTNSTATFVHNLTSEFYFGSATYVNGPPLVRSCKDDFLYVWGYYPGPSASTTISVSAMGCNRTAGTVDVEMTYVGANLQLDPLNPPRPLESTAKVIPGHYNISQAGTNIFSVNYATLDTLPLPKDTTFDDFFGQLVTSRYAVPLTALKDPARTEDVENAITFQNGVYAAQYIDLRFRVALNASMSMFPMLSSAATNDTGVYEATVTDPWGSQRVVQDMVGTRILQVLLLTALVLSVVSWVFGPRKPVLPRSPTSIASVLALLSGGNILEHLNRQNGPKDWTNMEELNAKFGDDCQFWMGMGPPGDHTPDSEKRFGIWASSTGKT